jgi:hypothetical protein
MTHRTPRFLILLLAFQLFLPAIAAAWTVNLVPAKDNSMFEEWPDNSNGAGDGVYVGQTNFSMKLRRGLMAFDLSSIPAGSTIHSVSLTLEATMAWPVASVVGLHRATADWGEAGSNGSGSGATALAGDATWMYRFWDTDAWSSAGGDFAATASDTLTVLDEGTYVWDGAGLVGDVQFWLDHPASNFGWVLVGDEVTVQTAKKFGSRESLMLPVLSVDYSPPVPGLSGWARVALALLMAAAAVPFVWRRGTRAA